MFTFAYFALSFLLGKMSPAIQGGLGEESKTNSMVVLHPGLQDMILALALPVNVP